MKRARVRAAAAAVVDANQGQSGADAMLLAADALSAMQRRSHNDCPSPPPPPRPAAPPPSQPASVNDIIADNARDLVRQLPPQPLRAPVLQALTRGLTPGDAVNFSGLSERATRRARREIGPFTKSPLFAAYSPRENNLVSDFNPERDATLLWMKDEMPAPSGSPNGNPLQRAPDNRFYADYIRALFSIVGRSLASTRGKPITRNQRLYLQAYEYARCRVVIRIVARQRHWQPSRLNGMLAAFALLMPRLVPVGPRVLEGWKKEIHVRKRRVYDGHFDCKHCINARQLRKAGKPLPAKLQQHLVDRDAQAAYRKQLRNAIPPDTLLLHIDFSNYPLLPNINDKDAIQTVWDLIMVAEWTADGEAQHRNLDFLCDSPGKEKHDAAYVEAAMRRARDLGWFAPFKRIEVFSDGCKKHFKCVYYFSNTA